MTQPDFHFVHPDFKFNELPMDRKDLCQLAETLLDSDAHYENSLGEFLLNWLDDSQYIEMNTSGSTGNPKCIRIKKQVMVNSAIATGIFFGLKPEDKVLNCLSAKYVAGKMMVVRSIILGLDMDFVAADSLPLKNNKTNYEFVAMVPLQVEESLNDLKLVKKLIIGGAQIDPLLEEKLIPLSTQTYATYGMTETVSHIALRKIGEKQYTVLPNVTIDVDDRNCLVIDAPDILDQKIVTNDLVELISPTQFIFLGRADNIINSGGIKFFPEQIEKKIAPFMNGRFFIIGKPDVKLGEKLVLVIEGKEQPLDSDIFSNLSQYEKPKEIIFVPKFKETETGKIIRKESLE
jgi:O-succinylbenzoic acid--CoA ligase